VARAFAITQQWTGGDAVGAALAAKGGPIEPIKSGALRIVSARLQYGRPFARKGGGAALNVEETRRELSEETVPPPTGTIFVMGMYMLALMAGWALMFWLLVDNS